MLQQNSLLYQMVWSFDSEKGNNASLSIILKSIITVFDKKSLKIVEDLIEQTKLN